MAAVHREGDGREQRGDDFGVRVVLRLLAQQPCDPAGRGRHEARLHSGERLGSAAGRAIAGQRAQARSGVGSAMSEGHSFGLLASESRCSP